MGSSCSNLNEFKNACDLRHCIKNVNGLESNSSSPTDTWLINFKTGTKYNNINISAGFVKWWISPLNLKNYNFSGKIDYINQLNGLNYEVKVYKDIIRPLCDLNICPNFIRYLANGNNCSFFNIARMLLDNDTSDLQNNKLTLRKAVDNLRRNINCMLFNENNRPKINDNRIIPQRPIIGYIKDSDYKDILNDEIFLTRKIQYNFLVNESIKKNTITFSHFSKYKHNIPGETSLIDSKERDNIFFKIIFQVIAGCYAMSLSKMSHNDLHLGNIYIEPCNLTTFVYKYGGKHFSFLTTHIVKIFDFDRSYVEMLGNNLFLDDGYCQSFNQCNEFIPNKDIIKFMGYIYNIIKNTEIKKKILECLTDNQDHIKKLKEIYKKGDFLNYKNNKKVKKKFFDKLFTPIDILINVSKLSNIARGLASNVELQNMFICSPKLFNNNGKVILESKSNLEIMDMNYQKMNAKYLKIIQENDKLIQENDKLIQENIEFHKKIKYYESLKE